MAPTQLPAQPPSQPPTGSSSPVASTVPRPPDAQGVPPASPDGHGHRAVPPPPTDSSGAARPWTAAAWMVLVLLLAWLPLTFALGYWVSTWFGVDPGSGETVVGTGALGWATDLGFGLVVGLPAWAGAACAVRARRLGAGASALAALVVDLVVAAALFALCVVVPL